MNKQHRLAYQAIKDVSQEDRGSFSVLLRVIGVSRQAYYKGLNREETLWEGHDKKLKERTKYWFNFHHQDIGAGNLLTDLQQAEKLIF